MTWLTIDAVNHIVLYSLAGQTIEAVVANPSSSKATVTGSSSIKAAVSGTTVRITGSPSGISSVKFGSTVVWVVDKETATTFWNPRLLTTTANFDLSADIPSVVVIGPYLVRNATIQGTTLRVFGDVNATTSIQIIAPKAVTSMTWNNQIVALTTTSTGTRSGSIPFTLSASSVVLPSLSAAAWNCTDSLPEVSTGFDDSDWVNANKTSTTRPLQPFAGKVGLVPVS